MTTPNDAWSARMNESDVPAPEWSIRERSQLLRWQARRVMEAGGQDHEATALSTAVSTGTMRLGWSNVLASLGDSALRVHDVRTA